MAEAIPRVVLITRGTPYEALLERHATRGQAKFFLDSRGGDIDAVEASHLRVQEALAMVRESIPIKWRRASVDRRDLDRFLFEPEDIVVAVGQDGLVANAAKYLDGQVVIGINPLPDEYDGVLVPHPPQAAHDLIPEAPTGRLAIERRTMVEARLDDGQVLRALNEVFVGHCTHQSARYRLAAGGAEERHSSSGVIVATGTGATGWARSINLSRGSCIELPEPAEDALAFFVREAFPSVATGTGLTEGRLRGQDPLRVTSEMETGGVVFGDGIESDRLDFRWGQTLEVTTADRSLALASP